MKLLSLPGKYRNPLVFALAGIGRELLRKRIRDLVRWTSASSRELEDGCTVLIGMASKMPFVLRANLNCLALGRWQGIKKVLIVVDNTEGCLPTDFEGEVARDFPTLPLEFHYYSETQSREAEALRLPYVYSWLSWCIGFSLTTTRYVFIQDYDALVLGDSLEKRYARFIDAGSLMQGISWYRVNGFSEEDRLATTFEAFVDTAWVRSFEPVMLFNKVSLYQGRTVDYDTLLDMQHNYTRPEERDIVPMDLHELVHPSQMIHQYTMFRKYPGKKLPCFSVIMIPFFSFLGGDDEAFGRAKQLLHAGPRERTALMGDGVFFNLADLDTASVDWILKQMTEVMVRLQREPNSELYTYGESLYAAARTPAEQVWLGDFTDEQREWIRKSAAVAGRGRF